MDFYSLGNKSSFLSKMIKNYLMLDWGMNTAISKWLYMIIKWGFFYLNDNVSEHFMEVEWLETPKNVSGRACPRPSLWAELRPGKVKYWAEVTQRECGTAGTEVCLPLDSVVYKATKYCFWPQRAH